MEKPQTIHRLDAVPRPFLKWAGGKGRLLRNYESLLPTGGINRYAEPFLGAGAMFFHLWQTRKPKFVWLSDVNSDLVLVWKTVRDQTDALLERLRELQKQYDSTPRENRNAMFLAVRKAFNTETRDGVLRAARFVFLNKTCFNGLFRRNAAGDFNVPFGGYENPSIADETTFYAVKNALSCAEIVCCDFSECQSFVDTETFVYFDPPYKPLSPTSSFTAYTGAVFSDAEQKRLADFFKTLDQKYGAKLMLSNSDHSIFQELYSGYNIQKVLAPRAINRDGAGRGKISEIVVTNYAHEPRTLALDI